MKNKKIKIALGVIIAALFASAFAACNVYEKEEVEIRCCPQVRDTIVLPGWDKTE
ncbi:hypothetical protein [uncultured Alistipes sp.]|uniref:hypothetical protein n=1 Tax=uncultured Alistipes sp. TaxID=538949 RepID=UPI00272C9866|nr:hypothetical protein [uncultured Alistipes sp.]